MDEDAEEGTEKPTGSLVVSTEQARGRGWRPPTKGTSGTELRRLRDAEVAGKDDLDRTEGDSGGDFAETLLRRGDVELWPNAALN